MIPVTPTKTSCTCAYCNNTQATSPTAGCARCAGTVTVYTKSAIDNGTARYTTATPSELSTNWYEPSKAQKSKPTNRYERRRKAALDRRVPMLDKRDRKRLKKVMDKLFK